LRSITQILQEDSSVDEAADPASQVGSDRELIMISFFKQMLVSRRWEDRFGALNGILAVIESRNKRSTRAPNDAEDYDHLLWEYLLDKSFP